MPRDGLLAECQSQSVPRVFFSVQALEDLEDPALEYGLYAGTVVFDGEYPIEAHPPG
jgi:hypothetical protein